MTLQANKVLIEELRKDLPKEGARVAFFQYGGGADESKMVGTKEGFQLLGIELLAFGLLSDEEKAKGNAYPDIASITDPGSDYRFDWFEIREEATFAETNEKSGSILLGMAGIFIFAWFVVMPFLGLYGIYRMIMG